MRNDIVTSSSVLLGLVLSTILNLPVIDQITAIIISVFIMKSAFSMFMETNNELMDGVDDVSIYDEICDVVESIKGVHHPHRIRIRKLSVQYVIDLDIEVDGDMTVSDAHELTRNVEEKIKDRIANVYDVIVHTEPLGNCEHNECFGYSRA
jgi:cation diffusion facilitator family transporter